MTEKFEKDQHDLDIDKKSIAESKENQNSVLAEYMRTHRHELEENKTEDTQPVEPSLKEKPVDANDEAKSEELPTELPLNESTNEEKEEQNSFEEDLQPVEATAIEAELPDETPEVSPLAKDSPEEQAEQEHSEEQPIQEEVIETLQEELATEDVFDDPGLEPIEEVMEAEPVAIREIEKTEIDQGPDIPPTTQENSPNNQKKYLAVLAIFVILIGCLSYFQYKSQQDQKEDKAHAEKIIDSYYTDKKHVFPKTEKIESGLSSVKEAVEKTKNQKEVYNQLSKEYQTLEEKAKQEISVNNLFTNAVISDEEYTPGVLKADQAIAIKKLTGKTAFDQRLNEAIEEAKAQYAQLQKAKESVKVVYTDKKVAEGATREQYQSAQAEVEKVKNTNLKTDLFQELKLVDESLTAKESEEKAEQEAEAQRAAEAAQQQAQEVQQQAQQTALAENSSSSSAASGSSATPGSIMTPNQAQINDSYNPAWTWNEGIQEKVIATCIERGYIVAGGYTLQRNSIIDGEGYYDLYATNLNSPLMKGYKADQLPVYLVTINCKTGWFKGRGPN